MEITPDPFDLASFELSALSDTQLGDLAADVALEQRRRAVAAADPSALIEDGFQRGFTSGGLALDPWLTGGILVCPGLLVEKAKSSHDCTFVSVKQQFDDTARWSWEATDLIDDEVRVLPGPRRVQRSISLISASEGLELDVVVSQMRQAAHRMKQVRSFAVQGGALVHVSTRARKPEAGHR
jgi:hypothetical protein